MLLIALPFLVVAWVLVAIGVLGVCASAATGDRALAYARAGAGQQQTGRRRTV
jgi:hypothetical protein